MDALQRDEDDKRGIAWFNSIPVMDRVALFGFYRGLYGVYASAADLWEAYKRGDLPAFFCGACDA